MNDPTGQKLNQLIEEMKSYVEPMKEIIKAPIDEQDQRRRELAAKEQ